MNDDKQIVGYYTISASVIQVGDKDDLEKSRTRETMTEYSAFKVQYFAVDSNFQRQGIGTLMMKRLLKDIFFADLKYNLGFKVVYLEALTEAIDFYDNFGFKLLKPWEINYNLKSSIMIMNYEELSNFIHFFENTNQ